VQRLDQVVLAHPGIVVVAAGQPDLGDPGDPEHGKQDGCRDLALARLEQCPLQPLPGGRLRCLLGRFRGRRIHEHVRVLERLLILGLGPGHAWKMCRRMAATLAKIRIPSTTITPVESWAPTPSLSPRKTISAAMKTLLMNETTKTLS